MAAPRGEAGTNRKVLTGETARGRRGGSFSRHIREANRTEVRRNPAGSVKSLTRGLQKEIKPGQKLLCLLFLFGLLFPGDEPANRAGMFAVKRVDERLFEWSRLRIAGDHGHPRDGLQKSPVAAERKRERNDRQSSQQS